jgi:2,3-bisphosphoglycerate-independent phosphoglycerate mutase
MEAAMEQHPKSLLLVILDGFGVGENETGNPVLAARKPNLDSFERFFPFMLLQASGVAVGLPWGEAGNSEVGHLTIGSGRIIYHHLPRIIYAIYDGSFFENPAFLSAAEHVRKNSSRLHLAGLVSSGSVHSYIDHLYALLNFAKRENIPETFIHIFTDGKDAPPKEGAKFLSLLEERMKKEWPRARIASIAGRFFALDRDNRWDRIQKEYELLTMGRGEKIASIEAYLSDSYSRGISDEFIEPAAVADEKGNPIGVIRKGDALIFTDFREDSMREIAHAFADESFDHFPREKIPDIFIGTMTEYDKNLAGVLSAFPPLTIHWPLSRVLGEAGLSHLHIAETQKYAHVTYFFNGGIERPFPEEERILIPSPAVAHFDEIPEMKAADITEKILENLDRRDVIIANYANADMIGHSGNFSAATKAVEVLDESLGRLAEAVLAGDGVMIITADHGNIELKRNALTGEKLTEHSLNPVPFFLIGKKFRRDAAREEDAIKAIKAEPGGILTDVAPTILELLDIKKPEEMTGQSLLSSLLESSS